MPRPLYNKRDEVRFHHCHFNALGLFTFNKFKDVTAFLIFNGAKVHEKSELTAGLINPQNEFDGSYSPLQIAIAQQNMSIAWLLFKKSKHDIKFICSFMHFHPKLLHALLPRIAMTISQEDFQKIWDQALCTNSLEVVTIVNQYLPANTVSKNPNWSIISNLRTKRWLRLDSSVVEFLLSKGASLTFDDFAYAVDILDVKLVRLFMSYGAHQLPTTHSGPLLNLLDAPVKLYSIWKNPSYRFFNTSQYEENYDEIVKLIGAVDKVALPQLTQEESKAYPLGLARTFP